MQLYKVKINPDTTKKENQVNGYLGNSFDNGQISLYTRGEAIKKAGMFNGKIEKHGKNFTFTEFRTAMLSKKEIHPTIVEDLKDREAFTDAEDLSETVFYGDVFDAILGEQFELPEALRYNEAILDELVILQTIMTTYTYFHLVD